MLSVTLFEVKINGSKHPDPSLEWSLTDLVYTDLLTVQLQSKL